MDTPSLSGGLISPPSSTGIFSQVAAPPARPPVVMRDMDDPIATRSAIYDRVLTAVRELPPLANKNYTLSVVDADYEDPERVSNKQRKEALLGGKTLFRRVRGTLRLTDNLTGQPIDQRKITMARVPALTDEGTFVLNGSETSLANQLRLRPGVFARRKENGELDGHVNVSKGLGHHLLLDPESSQFKLSIGQANLPLLPILRAMGAKDEQIRHAWGDQVWADNVRGVKDDRSVDRLVAKLLRNKQEGTPEEKKQKGIAALLEMTLDPEVTKRTLGQAYDKVSPDVYLALTSKLLKINRGEAETDDRDNPVYQRLYGPEDLLAERIRKSSKHLYPLFWRASLRKSLAPFQPGFLDKPLMSVMLSSGLANNLEDVNPMERLDRFTQVTRMGEGGITDSSAIPDSSRAVQPSHLGFLDPIRTPECYDEQTEVMTSSGWKAWPDVVDTDRLACLVNGRLEFHKPIRLIRSDYSGPMYGARSEFLDYLVTPNHRMWIKRGWRAEMKFEPVTSTYDKHYRGFQTGGHLPCVGDREDDVFVLPAVAAGRAGNFVPEIREEKPLCVDDWAELVGWYLSEGSFHSSKRFKQHTVQISQSLKCNPENYRRIGELLGSLGFHATKISHGKGWTVSSKQLMDYFRKFGFCDDKWIPEELLTARVSARRRLFESLLLGDGRRVVRGSRKGEHTQFCTSSERLSKGFERLAFSLGYSCRTVFERDDREDRYLGCFVTHLHQMDNRVLTRRSHWTDQPYHYKEENWSGMVYCAEVPGNLLYVRRNGSVGFWCGNSTLAGVDLRAASRLKKGDDNNIYAPFRDARTGKEQWLSPGDIAEKAIAFPGELKKDKKYVRGIVGGRLRFIHRDKVDLEAPEMEHNFNHLANLLPFKSASKGQRDMMGSRMIGQALPLTNPETALVQTGYPGSDNESYHERFGRFFGAVHAKDQAGKVVKVTPEEVVVRYADGQEQTHDLHNQTPTNRKTLLHNTPAVKEGDEIKPKQLLAWSNFTDKNGHAAFGRNLRVAFVPYLGESVEDAIIVSESAAKDKLTSEHAYQHPFEWDAQTKRGKNAYVSFYPAKYDREALATIDDDGIVRPGTTVQPGAPLVLGIRERERAHNQITRGNKPTFVDASLTWDHETPGVVTDAFKNDKGVTVVVRAEAPMQVGDKLSNLYGGKGVISKILPDDQMPKDEQGRPMEVLLNSLGLISRTNASQIHEANLGKIAAKTGMPYKVQDFGDVEDLQQFVENELKKHGMRAEEDLLDPVTGRTIPAVQTGVSYLMKLHHTAASKAKARGVASYTAEDIPARGGDEGCFAPKQKINTARGERCIAEICEKRLGVHVLTYSESLREWVYRPIVDWFIRRAKTVDLLTVEYHGKPAVKDGGRVKQVLGTFHATKNHEILLFNGARVAAGDLQVGDELVTWGPVLTRDQRAFLLGTMLGDAWCSDQAFGVTHSVKQIAYTTWKREVLAGLDPVIADRPAKRHFNHKTGKDVFSKKARTIFVSHPHVRSWLDDECYGNRVVGRTGAKKITESWLRQLSDLSVAVWLLDDGGITNRAKKRGQVRLTGKFATQSFTPDDRATLAAWLQDRYGGQVSVHECGILYLNAAICEKLIEVVASVIPWQVIPGSKKFLRERVAAIQKKAKPRQLDVVCEFGKVPLRITDIRPYRHDKNVTEINVYDFTVADTHTYCANGALVSNSKRFATMHLDAALSAGAHNFIRDTSLVRGQKHLDDWAKYMAGQNMPPAKVPLTHRKFFDMLLAAGVNPIQTGNKIKLLALTDDAVDKMTEDRTITNSETVDWREGLKELEGGLFDRTLTGGHGGQRMAKMLLHEPMPNPIMEEGIRRVLGLTEQKMLDVLAGKHELDGETGPAGLQSALSKINLDRTIEQLRAEVKSGKKTKRDVAIKKLQYLIPAQRDGLHPKDWMITRVPVVPPLYRPVSVMQSGSPLVADLNLLYRDLFDVNASLGEMHGQVEDLSEERLGVYGALKALAGAGDPITPKNRERNVRGVLSQVLGSSPKYGMVQQKLLGRAVDLVGRAVISPDVNLDMDEVGLPEEKAWDVYRPFVVRRLVRSGFKPMDALRLVKDRKPVAKTALEKELTVRPVVIDRAPVLHRFGVIGQWPKLVHGDTMRINPYVLKGLAADYDGDQMNFHVPFSDEAIDDVVEKMMPSKNLLHPQNFKAHFLPINEFKGGLYHSSVSRKDQPAVKFKTVREALLALKLGKTPDGVPVDSGTPIEVEEEG